MKRLRVALDVAGALMPKTGIGRYTRSLYAALRGREELRRVAFCNNRGGDPTLGLQDEVTNPRWPARVLNTSWQVLRWPPIERFTGAIDVFHTSDWSHPPLRGAARVTTVHDLGALLHPEWYAADIAHHHARHNRETVRRSDRVIAISQYTRQGFLDRYRIEEDRVVVVPNGVDPSFRPASEAAVQETRTRLELRRPYVLYVGTREPRKNLRGLIDIFVRLADRYSELDLAIVGARPWAEARAVHGAEAWSGREVEEGIARSGLKARVHVLGSIGSRDLVSLYSGARAFLFPSLFEGFGLPVLEAMACGCPVIASARTALPEVVGDAGVLADPEDADGFAAAAASVLDDAAVRSAVIAAGLERAQSFTWDACAERTARVYEQAARR